MRTQTRQQKSEAERAVDIRRAILAGQRLTGLVALAQTDPGAMLAAVATDRDLQSPAMAANLLRYYDRFYDSLHQHVATVIVEAALIACANCGDHDVLCWAWKEKANTHRGRARFDDAEAALEMAAFHAERVPRDRALYHAIVKYGRAALAYDRRQTDDASKILREVIAEFDRLGESARADSARTFLAAVDYRQRDICAALPRFKADLAAAITRGDEEDVARHRGAIAACYVHLGRYVDATRELDAALAICVQYGMVIVEVRCRRIGAQLAIRRDGVREGLVAIERVHARCRDLDMPAEAALTLVYAVETLHEIASDAEETIVALCRRIHAECGRLQLAGDAAEAATRLAEAAQRHSLTDDHIRLMKDAIDPGAPYRAEHLELAN